MFTKRVWLLVCLILGLLVASPNAQNPNAIQDLGTLGGTQASAQSVNSHGQIVGWSTTGVTNPGSYYEQTHAFLYTAGGGMVDLGTLPGGDLSYATGINDAGQVVGHAYYAQNAYHAFLYTAETGMVDLTPGGSNSQATGINNLGQIVGWMETADGAQGFLYDTLSTQMTMLPSLWKAQAINDRGQIVGESAITYQAALYDLNTGVTTKLGTLGSTPGLRSYAYGINNDGWVVGQSETDVIESHGDHVRHAFLYADGVMKDLGTLDGPAVTDTTSTAMGVNDLGQIVGDAHSPAGDTHAFVYTVGGGMKDLGTVATSDGTGHSSSAAAISGARQAVGYSAFPTTDDPYGNSHYHAVTWPVVDTTPPVLTVPAGVTVEATSSNGTPVNIGHATAVDDLDPNPVVTNDAPALFPLGATAVTWTATDASDNTATAIQTVTVRDTTPPAITAPASVTANATSSNGIPAAQVNLGAPIVSDIGDPNPAITNNAPALFPVGTTTVTWTATDHSGNTATATQRVTVIATPPATVKVSATPNSIWPPNKKMVPVTVTVTATSGGPAPSARIVSVTCNEAIAASDVKITGLLTVNLRADRNGNGTGRVYTITLQCTSGNTCPTVVVKVPHDQGK